MSTPKSSASLLAGLAATRLAKLPTKRTAARKAPTFIDEKFPAQAAYIADTASLIVVLCTRRAGKSFGAALKLLQGAYRYPGCSCLFIALTRDSAKKILWKDCLKVINRTLDLGAKFNETDLTMTLPNGSVIYLLGVDTTEEEKQKLLGQKYAEVVIDEAASFSIDLYELVYGILKPAVADYHGCITLIGTPGNLKRGTYFDLTKSQDPTTAGRWEAKGWSGHRWSALDNPYMRDNWLAEIAELKAANPRIEETPLFQQHYLGRWVIDDSKLVYRYLAGRNDFDGTLPILARGSWHHVLGVDLGFNDATSFSVGAYHDFDRTLYGLRSWKKAGLDITDVATEIRKLVVEFEPDRTIVDGSNKQAVEEMRRRHDLQLMPADKTGKAEFIDLMNAEFIQGRIKLSPDCQPLKDEYAGLIWDERGLEKGKREEHPSCENHCADGKLYLWRYAYPYLSETLVDRPKAGSQEWRQQQAEEMRDMALRQLEDQRAVTQNSVYESVSGSDGWDPFFSGN